MSMTINAPTAKVTTYDVANQTAVQFNFDFDPTQFRADGTTLVLEYEGNEIRLENFFDADGKTQVEEFLTQDGQAFVASEFLAAIMGGTEGGTAEDIETAAGAAAGGSGAGVYSDDPGSLFDGLDALDGQPDAYAQVAPPQLDELPGPNLESDNTIPYEGETRWDLFEERDGDYVYDTWYERLEYAPQPGEDSSANNLNTRQDSIVLDGQLRTFTSYQGTPDVDTLVLPDDPWGAVLRLEDNLSLLNGGPGIQDIEIIQGGSGSDVVDLSSDVFTYGDVTVYGNGGNDFIWTSIGDDTISGGDGHDNIIGGMGNDLIFGDAGNDIIKGSVGDDTLSGGEGHDKLYGGTGDDVISGDAGNDAIDGGAGNDIINGGDDADLIFGGAGNDQLYGGEGNDMINAGTGGLDYVTLGAGQDTLFIDATSVTDGFYESIVWVNDFVDGEDQLMWAPGYQILEWGWGNDGDAFIEPALLIGESLASNNTWVVLDGGMTFADLINSSDISLSPAMETEIQFWIDSGALV